MAKRGRKKALEGQERHVCHLYHETDMSVSAVARHFGVSAPVINKILQEHGKAYRDSMKEPETKKSDSIQGRIDQLEAEWERIRGEIEALKREQTEALVEELPDVMPLLRSAPWSVYDFSVFSLEEASGELELHAQMDESHPVAVLLSRRSGVKAKQIAEGVQLRWWNERTMELTVDLGSMPQNVQWCLEHGLRVTMNRAFLETYQECQEAVVALGLLLESGAGSK